MFRSVRAVCAATRLKVNETSNSLICSYGQKTHSIVAESSGEGG